MDAIIIVPAMDQANMVYLYQPQKKGSWGGRIRCSSNRMSFSLAFCGDNLSGSGLYHIGYLFFASVHAQGLDFLRFKNPIDIFFYIRYHTSCSSEDL